MPSRRLWILSALPVGPAAYRAAIVHAVHPTPVDDATFRAAKAS
jgi:hypothetical protein